MESSKSSLILSELALQLPVMIAIVSCVVLLTVRWKRHPAVCGLAITGLALILIHMLVFTNIYAWVPDLLPVNPSTADIMKLYLIVGLIFNTTFVAVAAPLLVAIFIKRRGSHYA